MPVNIDKQIEVIKERLELADTSGPSLDGANQSIGELILACGHLITIAEEQQRRIETLEAELSRNPNRMELPGPKAKNFFRIGDSKWINLDKVTDLTFDGERYKFYTDLEATQGRALGGIKADKEYTPSINARLTNDPNKTPLEQAAPDLLKACKAALPYLADHMALTSDEMRGFGGDPGDSMALDLCERAIAKAEAPATKQTPEPDHDRHQRRGIELSR